MKRRRHEAGSQQRLRMRLPQHESIGPARRSTMKKKRNRSRPALPLQEPLNQIAVHAREKAAGLPPGRERERLMEVAVANEAAAVIDRWLSSPGLRIPK